MLHGVVFGRRALVRQEMHPGFVAVLADRRIERAVGSGKPAFHGLDIAGCDLEFGGNAFPSPVVERLAGAPLDAGAQPAQVEEQRLLGRGGARADDGPVAQDIVLHGRADPPGGVGRETNFPLRLETGRCLHQADGPFLHQVRHRQAVIAVFRGRGRDQARIGVDQFVQGCLVLQVAPAQRQFLFALASEQRRAHRMADEIQRAPAIRRPVQVAHLVPSCAAFRFPDGRTALQEVGSTASLFNRSFGSPSRKAEGGLPVSEQTAFRCDILSLSGQAACKTISTLLTALSSSILSTTASSRLSRSSAAW